MNNSQRDEVYPDLDIGEEQVTSNECWAPEEMETSPTDPVYPPLSLGEEQVTSNECYNVDEEEE